MVVLLVRPGCGVVSGLMRGMGATLHLADFINVILSAVVSHVVNQLVVVPYQPSVSFANLQIQS